MKTYVDFFGALRVFEMIFKLYSLILGPPPVSFLTRVYTASTCVAFQRGSKAGQRSYFFSPHCI